MNGDTAELLTAINESISNEIKPLRDDIGAVRTAVQDRGERLVVVEQAVKTMGNCGKNTEKIDEASRGVTTNRNFMLSLVLVVLAGVLSWLKWG